MSGAGGRELLREVNGVVGSLVDLVEIDEGWEAAFEAAAGAGVATVVVDGPRSAQRALTTLRERGVTGAVLAPRAGRAVAVSDPDRDLPPGTSAEPVRRHVRARHGGEAAESVLDALVGRAVRVDGWEEAIDLSLAHDDLVVVTPDGDRFAATGWRVRSGAAVVTAAAVEEAGRRAAEAARRGPSWPGPGWRSIASPWRAAATPGPRRSVRSTATSPRSMRVGPTCSARWRSPAGWRPSSTKPGPSWKRPVGARPRWRPTPGSSRRPPPRSTKPPQPGTRSKAVATPWPGGRGSWTCGRPDCPSAAASCPSVTPRSSGVSWATPRNGRPRRLGGGPGWRTRARPCGASRPWWWGARPPRRRLRGPPA